jgi:hypothetical protein
MPKQRGEQVDGMAIRAQGVPPRESAIDGNVAGRLVHAVNDHLETIAPGPVPPLDLAIQF